MMAQDKINVGTDLYCALKNMFNAGNSFDNERICNYLSHVFGFELVVRPNEVKAPSNAVLKGAANVVFHDCVYYHDELQIRLKVTVDLSWMISDRNAIPYHHAFLPYEARMYVRISGRKKEDVLTDTGYLNEKPNLEWNIEDAFIDRGIHYRAEEARQAVMRNRKRRARNMMHGVGMELYA